MDCKEFRNIVADLFDKDVAPSIKAKCEKHMNECNTCRRYYEDTLAAAEALRPKHSPVARCERKSSFFTFHSSLFKVAASLVGILMLSGIALAAYHAKSSGQTVIEPQSIHAMPKITKAEWDRYMKLLDEKGEPTDTTGYGDLTVYNDLYGCSCSWYCGGRVKSVTASSHLSRIGAFTYEAENAHDFNHETVWATKGKGTGESLTYTFEGSCPRITKVKILNGHVKNEKIWRANSRVKRLRMYFGGKPIATLSLQDSRSLQTFDVGTLGYHDSTKPDWTLSFEILDVYPGSRYDDTVIAELYFDGIDVH
ncbi:MAG: hypothetical protein IJ537_03345 [Bacteroidaceae bacterium]|nr:hypothetical protein [Bacteroidaceae bacterium]